MKPILFPGLGLTFDISNVAFHLLGKDIYWYGIIITCGLLLAMILAKRDKQKYGIQWDDITSFLIYALIVGFICARIYYVIFKWDYYSMHLDEIIKIWNGGIAIYGGVIGALITGFIFCKRKKISFFNLCDFCAPYLALAQSIGRWGNFFNREAYGGPTNSLLRMGIYHTTLNEYQYVHPTFLYESVANFFIFVILLLVKKKQKFDGQIFELYMILYGIARFFIEGLRADSLYLGPFRISQMLALLFVLLFSTLFFIQTFKRKNNAKKEN